MQTVPTITVTGARTTAGTTGSARSNSDRAATTTRFFRRRDDYGVPTVYITAPRDHAERLARTLVEERLAACVNRVACQSVYRWEGTVHEDPETVLLAKTTADRYEELVARVRDLHPHDVPCIERFEEADIADAFADWRARATE